MEESFPGKEKEKESIEKKNHWNGVGFLTKQICECFLEGKYGKRRERKCTSKPTIGDLKWNQQTSIRTRQKFYQPRGSWNIDNHHGAIWDFMPYFLLITHAFISLLIQICMKYLLVDISFHAASPYVRE